MFSIPALDALTDEQLRQKVHAWVASDTGVTTRLDELQQAYNLALPRTVFFKSLPTNANVLDVGAGEGSMAIYKDWPMVERPDLRLHALSLAVGRHFDRCESYEIKNFETETNLFPGLQFDAMICAHFIEHMRDPEPSVRFFSERMRAGGRLYIEWPHQLTKRLPSRTSIIDLGIEISTFNFFDDDTHIEAWEAETIIGHLERNGFAVESGGRIFMPWIGEQMKNHAHRDGDSVHMTLGAWSAFGWSQYLIASKN
jgi:2-polyprenyl-3-methyl-5-hydroxy-6-metoxy-1,4-benzoquinol methylase